MKLSKFFKSVNLDNGVTAIFNSLVMDVAYVNEEELNKIKKMEVDDKNKIKLKEMGIYVKNSGVDDEALNHVIDRYTNICGKISIMYLILSSSCNLACKQC